MTKRTVFLIALASALCIGPSAFAQNADTNERFQALVGMARVKRDAGDLASARRYFEEARRVRSFDAAELGEYFWILAGQDARAALAIGREVLSSAPTNRDVRDRMITESLTLGDEASVVALAQEGQRRQPGTALWSRRLAESYQRQGMPEQAIVAFVRALMTLPLRLGLAVGTLFGRIAWALSGRMRRGRFSIYLVRRSATRSLSDGRSTGATSPDVPRAEAIMMGACATRSVIGGIHVTAKSPRMVAAWTRLR